MGFLDLFRKQNNPKKAVPVRPERDGFAAVKQAQQKVQAPPLKLSEDDPRKSGAPEKGFDPYNSGAYDRRGAWEKVTRK